MAKPKEEEILTLGQVAKLLKVSDRKIYRLMSEVTNPIPYSKVGGTRRFLKADVLEWLRSRGECSMSNQNLDGPFTLPEIAKLHNVSKESLVIAHDEGVNGEKLRAVDMNPGGKRRRLKIFKSDYLDFLERLKGGERSQLKPSINVIVVAVAEGTRVDRPRIKSRVIEELTNGATLKEVEAMLAEEITNQ